MNTKTITILIALLPCVMVYLILMYGGIRGLTCKNIGLEKYLENPSIATVKNTVQDKGLFLCLIFGSILFTVTDILVLNNIRSLQDRQLTKVTLGISIIPQSIFTLPFGLH